MPVRPLKLPDDLNNLYDLIIEAFQYPENPEWNIDSDEVEGIKDTVNTLRRIWPLYRLIKWTTPALRDALLGFVWEEQGSAVGTVTLSRRGSTDSWMVGNVCVLPNFRRRGIARQLVETALNTIRTQRGNLVVLDVIAGNIPAYKLYESLGFVQYTSGLEMELKTSGVPEPPVIPEGFSFEAIPQREWRLPMQMAKRTVPANVQAFDPITEKRYRHSWTMRLFFNVMNKLQRVVVEDYALKKIETGEVVAMGFTTAQTKPGGRHSIRLVLGPEQAELALFLIESLLYKVKRLSPEHVVETVLWEWCYFSLAAHQKAGFESRKEGQRMGLVL
jgi:ribosomal protein S18 acetylase RimI-like enzyme